MKPRHPAALTVRARVRVFGIRTTTIYDYPKAVLKNRERRQPSRPLGVFFFSFRLAAEPELKQIGWVGKDLSQGFDFVC